MAIQNTTLIIRLISIVVGLLLGSLGFYVVYRYRRIDKVTLGILLVAVGLILLLYGIGIINFMWTLW